MGLFLVTNLLAFIFIVCCYVYMYKTVRQSGQRLTRMIQSKEVRERQVGKQMAMIVLTDFCCWCPIIILGERLRTDTLREQCQANRSLLTTQVYWRSLVFPSRPQFTRGSQFSYCPSIRQSIR